MSNTLPGSLKLQRDKLKQYQKKVCLFACVRKAVTHASVDPRRPRSRASHRKGTSRSWQQRPRTHCTTPTEVPAEPSDQNGSATGELGADGALFRLLTRIKTFSFTPGWLGLDDRVLVGRSVSVTWPEARK